MEFVADLIDEFDSSNSKKFDKNFMKKLLRELRFSKVIRKIYYSILF